MQHWYQNDAGTWQNETVVSDSRGHSNLAFSDDGTPYGAYIDVGDTLKLVTKSDLWQSEIVGTFSGVRGDGISVALSPKGQVYIAAASKTSLRLYTKINGHWKYYVLNANFVTPAIQSKPPSILFGSGGPIVIYNDATKIFRATLKGLSAQ